MGKSILKEHSFRFAIEIIQLYKNLVLSKKEFVLSKQLLKSGTSIGKKYYPDNKTKIQPITHIS
jgi:four helix bundle protein